MVRGPPVSEDTLQAEYSEGLQVACQELGKGRTFPGARLVVSYTATNRSP